jgi:ATP-dependent DNA helicase DinG
VIASIQAGHAADARRLREVAAAAFEPGGMLAGVSSGDFLYEARPQQVEMARAVSDALESGRHLVVEAGTGVGKSLAYLVPLILHAKRTNRRAMVSTHTISLQEQLVGKDLPLLKERLGPSFRAVLVKGRTNYLCLRRLARARNHQRELFGEGIAEELERIRAWADATEDGSVQEMRRQPSPEAWAAVCAEHGNCMGPKCPERKRCFLFRARAQMHDADLLVANHHLLFSDLALRREGAGFLPDVAAVVMDEAHTVEDTASEHLGIRLSPYAFEHWLRRLLTPETGKGLLGYLRAGPAAQTVTRLWDAVSDLFHEVPRSAGLGARDSQKVVPGPLAVTSEVPELLRELSGRLAQLIEELEDQDEESRAELRGLRGQGLGLGGMLEAFLGQTMPDHVYWIEREGKRRQVVLHSAPIEVAPLLEETLFAQIPTVVLTSATLAVGGRLEYCRDRLGAGKECELLCLGSPFDHARQMRLHVATNAPDPKDREAFAEAVAKGVLRWALKTRGRAFALFTSDELLKRTAETVREPLEKAGLTLLAQGGDLTRRAMLETFRKDAGFVLFGLDSFWMGVDVRGEALSNVILTRLPFAVPDHPVVAARLKRIKEKGGDPFREYSLPEAVLKFRQGFGRLIRSQTDEGIVVVLDSRILTKWYGRIFLRSLPECPVDTFEL